MVAAEVYGCAWGNIPRHTIEAVADHAAHRTDRLAYHEYCLPRVMAGRTVTQAG